jgi:hypothetical protein
MPIISVLTLHGPVIRTTSDICGSVDHVEVSYSFSGVVGDGPSVTISVYDDSLVSLGSVILDPAVDASSGTVFVDLASPLVAGRLLVGISASGSFPLGVGSLSFTELTITDVWVGPI